MQCTNHENVDISLLRKNIVAKTESDFFFLYLGQRMWQKQKQADSYHHLSIVFCFIVILSYVKAFNHLNLWLSSRTYSVSWQGYLIKPIHQEKMQLAVSDPIQAQMNPINFFFFLFFLNHLLHIAGAPRLPSFFIPIYSSHHSSNALYKASSLLIRKAFRASLVLTILLQISKQLKLHKFRSCSNSNSQSGIGEN